MTDPSSYDTKRYPLCSPYSGEIGPPFTRVFKPAFLSAISASSDKYANYGAHLRGMDPGGILPPTPAQLATNPNQSCMAFSGQTVVERYSSRWFSACVSNFNRNWRISA